MIREKVYAFRLGRRTDVSPTLKVVAAAALAGSRRRVRKRILDAIRDTARKLTDPGQLQEAEYNLREARAQAERAAMETLTRLDTSLRPMRAVGPLRRRHNRELADWSRDQGYARRAVEILNDLLASIGRPPV